MEANSTKLLIARTSSLFFLKSINRYEYFRFKTTFLYNIKNISNSFLVKIVFPMHVVCFKSRIRNRIMCVTLSNITLKNVQIKNKF